MRAHPVALEVCDDAVPGSGRNPTGRVLGLGHQVVRRIADVHGGRFDVLPPDAQGMRAYRLLLEDASSA